MQPFLDKKNISENVVALKQHYSRFNVWWTNSFKMAIIAGNCLTLTNFLHLRKEDKFVSTSSKLNLS